EDCDPLAALKPALEQRARDRARHRTDLRIGEFARRLLTAKIDDRDLVEVAVAHDDIAKIGEARHGHRLLHAPLVPAKAGTQGPSTRTSPSLGPRFRGDEPENGSTPTNHD